MLLRRYRLLLIVAGLTALSILMDWYHYGTPVVGPTGNLYSIGKAAADQRRWDQRYDTYIAVYPNRPEMLFEQGLRATRAGDDLQAKDFYERAIATGFKTSENLYYEYAQCLIRLQAPQSEIDAATEHWKKLFPLSQRPDPREAQASSDNPQPSSRPDDAHKAP